MARVGAKALRVVGGLVVMFAIMAGIVAEGWRQVGTAVGLAALGILQFLAATYLGRGARSAAVPIAVALTVPIAVWLALKGESFALGTVLLISMAVVAYAWSLLPPPPTTPVS
jgi:hypothetical protein